jgi:serine/threonine-protein kinase
LSLAVQTARGLAAAHEELIVHCDIKPANLLITRDDTVKILDFGLARLLKHGAFDAGIRVGTPLYMSPEQLRGDPVDQRTDIWAMGVVLHEMLTGERPFAAERPADVIAAVLSNVPVSLSAAIRNYPGRS